LPDFKRFALDETDSIDESIDQLVASNAKAEQELDDYTKKLGKT